MDLKNLENGLLHPPQDLSVLSAEEQFRLIKDKAAAGHSIVSEAALVERLKESKSSGKPLKIKFGIDPTGPQIHIGHAVPLINLRRLLRMGHEIHVIIGDFTAMVGDPGERMDARAPLTSEQVGENMATYAAQASRIIDFSSKHVHLHYNSAWLGKLSLSKWMAVTKGITVSSLLQRDDFRKRMEGGHSLSLAEFEYVLLMGYDSVEIKPDIEIGGMDQFLNFHFCRNMMEMAGQRPECIITNDLLPGTNGEKDAEGRLGKMSKSRGNYIAVESPAADMYGKVMSIPDEVMWIWYRELTEISSADLDALKKAVEGSSVHPKEAKQLLARVVVATFHPNEPGALENAEKDFNSKFGKAAQLVPDSVQEVAKTDAKVGELLAGVKKVSMRQARQVREQNGLQILDRSQWLTLSPEQFNALSELYVGHTFKWGRDYFKIVA